VRYKFDFVNWDDRVHPPKSAKCDRLETYADFRGRFSEHLIGRWCTDIERISATDRDLIFHPNGRGEIDAVYGTGYSAKFKWRTVMLRLLEVQPDNQPNLWIPITWNFIRRPDAEAAPPLLCLSVPEGAVVEQTRFLYELTEYSYEYSDHA